jgi:hypothetical protein
MYEIDQGWWFVPIALNKFTVSPRNNLKPSADGSLTLYSQNESRARKRAATAQARRLHGLPGFFGIDKR